MTIDKAINTLSAMLENYEGDEYPNEEDAIKLGIEALKRLKSSRDTRTYPIDDSLPGETGYKSAYYV